MLVPTVTSKISLNSANFYDRATLFAQKILPLHLFLDNYTEREVIFQTIRAYCVLYEISLKVSRETQLKSVS